MTLDTNAGDTSTPYMRFWFQADVTGGQASGVQRHHVGVEAFQAPGALGNNSWAQTWRYGPGECPNPPRRSLVSTCLGEDPLRLLPVP